MSEEDPCPEPRFDPSAAAFEDPTPAFGTFSRWGERGVTRLRGRRLVRCNLAGPAFIALAGKGNSFADCIFSGRGFVVAPESTPVEAEIRLANCAFEDRILTRWAASCRRRSPRP